MLRMLSTLLCLACLLAGTAAFAAELVPQQVGQCTLTTISDLGYKLETNDDRGRVQTILDPSRDEVRYVDGIEQYSMTKLAGLKGARKGDPVKLCLTEVPDECPPGDDRGKVFKATDLKTGKSWEAMNSEHDCGGA